MELIILTLLFAISQAAPAGQSLTFHDDGSYKFHYETGEGGGSHSRSESRNPDGVVIGKFSYQDPDGEMREISYRADKSGFVAQGDVGVAGAPKGQFPAVISEDQPKDQTPVTTETVGEQENPNEDSKTDDLPEARTSLDEPRHNEDDEDDMQDLTFNEPIALDDPPEGFPPGFFLEKYQGLRRLPEPTKKPTQTEATTKKPTSTEATTKKSITDDLKTLSSTEAPKQDMTEKPTATDIPEITEVPEDSSELTPYDVKSGGSDFFAPLKPFQSFSPHEWAPMFHQPVYVFAYNQPDSYGYHYYF